MWNMASTCLTLLLNMRPSSGAIPLLTVWCSSLSRRPASTVAQSAECAPRWHTTSSSTPARRLPNGFDQKDGSWPMSAWCLRRRDRGRRCGWFGFVPGKKTPIGYAAGNSCRDCGNPKRVSAAGPDFNIRRGSKPGRRQHRACASCTALDCDAWDQGGAMAFERPSHCILAA